MRTQVAIIGGGPAGLLLSRKLTLAGIDSVLLERQSRAYVLSRIRAGVLESGTAAQLRAANVGDRMDAEGFVHDGCLMASADSILRIDFKACTGKTVIVYGQTEITKDLYEALEESESSIRTEIKDAAIHGADSDAPCVTFSDRGRKYRLDCDFIAGCDGFHGISRNSIPAEGRREFVKTYPFGWLGVLSETPPVNHELIYSKSPRGFALASLRNQMLSRYYIQVEADTEPESWSDEEFWSEFRRRLPERFADSLVTGPSIEKSVAPLRSFVSEPMRYGRLFLCGDSAHIVPPTGAKGLNLAASDVHYLFEALNEHYSRGGQRLLDAYSEQALTRVWKAMRFSWWMTNMLHRFEQGSSFDRRIQDIEFAYLRDSDAAKHALAENYAGLPY